MTITTILVSALLSNFASFASSSPGLCDIAHMGVDGSPISDSAGRHLARYCEWTGPDAPVLGADVCCEVDEQRSACMVPDANGRCSVGERYSCEHGEVTPLGGVVCYQPFPDACDAGFCVAPPDVPQEGQAEMMLCCGVGGACQAVTLSSAGDCDGDFLACDYGIQNADGTVDCLD